MKSEIEIKGSKKQGWWTVIISDDQGYKEDFAVTTQELKELKRLITKKLK